MKTVIKINKIKFVQTPKLITKEDATNWKNNFETRQSELYRDRENFERLQSIANPSESSQSFSSDVQQPIQVHVHIVVQN